MSKFLWWYFEFIFSHWLYHDTLKLSVNYDCNMIQWVSISEMKEAWNGSILLHLPCLYDFGYVHWMYHDTFKLWICIECIMIQSRVKPEILSSNCVLIRKLPTVLYNFYTVQYCTVQGTTPPHKSEFFSLHFWMNQAISNIFPRVLEKTQKNPKKSLDLAPPPGLENFQTF